MIQQIKDKEEFNLFCPFLLTETLNIFIIKKI